MSYSVKDDVLNHLLTTGDFKIIHRTHGTEHRVYEITEERKFVIADKDGFRQLVEAHVEDCDCDLELDYYIPLELYQSLMKMSIYTDYAVDYALLNTVRTDIDKGKQPPAFIAGDFIVYQSERHIGIQEGSSFIYPSVDMLVYVTSVYYCNDAQQWLMNGYSTNGQHIVPVSGECWRFNKFNRPEDLATPM